MDQIQTRCTVVGGGPAGMMLGFLLARAGVEVVVLEKHADFLRDFRGDTIHPSTLELMYELHLLDEFLKQPHQELSELRATINRFLVPIADFSKLPTHCKFIAFMPQWDFLTFVGAQAKQFPTFTLRMESSVEDLLFRDGRVIGVRATTPAGELEVRADLVVGADGRHSTVRDRAGFKVLEFGVPIDVLWTRLSKKTGDPAQSLGFFERGRMLVLIDRGEYWQCGVVIPKGDFEKIKAAGFPELYEYILAVAPFLQDRMTELDDWTKIKLLTVQINRLREWCRDGLLCIGDSAHAMSPAGGIGINLAIQDAVATANLLAVKLRSGPVSVDDLRRVQQRREWPTGLIQRMQVFIHRRITGRPSPGKAKLPFVVRLLRDLPFLRHIPARFIGMGPRPEHVRSPVVDR